mgnify:CR=1 FL=1
MVEALKWFIEIVNKVHRWILSLNDQYTWALSDKDLHFIVFGLLALGFFIMIHALFRRLAKISINLLSFIYTFTVMFALALAIEFGQRVTRQGVMDFDDVLSGMVGFVVFFLTYQFVIFIIKAIQSFVNKDRKR